MKKNSPLYNALNQWLGQANAWSHLTHLTTCVSMLVALIQTGSVNLTQWLPHIPFQLISAIEAWLEEM